MQKLHHAPFTVAYVCLPLNHARAYVLESYFPYVYHIFHQRRKRNMGCEREIMKQYCLWSAAISQHFIKEIQGSSGMAARQQQQGGGSDFLSLQLTAVTECWYQGDEKRLCQSVSLVKNKSLHLFDSAHDRMLERGVWLLVLTKIQLYCEIPMHFSTIGSKISFLYNMMMIMT